MLDSFPLLFRSKRNGVEGREHESNGIIAKTRKKHSKILRVFPLSGRIMGVSPLLLCAFS